MFDYLTRTLGNILVCVAIFVAIGCTPTFRNHGYVPTEASLEELVVGVDTRGTVEEIVGPPNSTGVMQDGGWYYISTKIKHETYRQPKIVEREVVAISFDEDGVVTNIERFGLKDGRIVVLNRRVTELPVKGPGILGQILGTFGNIDAGQILGQ